MSEAIQAEPRDLYSPAILSDISGRLNRRWLVLAVVALPLLALFIFSMISRIRWLSMVSAVVLGFFAVFWIDLFVIPALRYRNLVRNALTGRAHVKTLEFARMDPDPCQVDGVSCRSLIFLGEPDRHGSREQLLYLDRAVPLPDLQPGQSYAVRFSGRTITGLSA